jgi:RimJ/RimL family protein N-acetyltransferase
MPDVAPEIEFTPVEVRLRDGRRVTLRAIRADDKDKLQVAIRALSVQSSYYRFFSPLRELSPQLLERATRPEQERELQLVAVVGEGAQEKIIGGARYAAVGGSGDCEFAVAIVDEWHGLGLARQLLEALMRTARARGFERMEGSILSTNRRMLGLAKRLGFAEMTSPEGPTVRTVRRDLRAVP